ncbi:lamin tail domain-containing protein [Agrilutibacter solisilvae]|uniref:Lamin tail domain-containing protein n=1 Tax=Agrilutibacter solisilvae TaxID=2763317 RepID=A0A974Y343_9GAMM|nr:lamin tail domain-containing protein [Lysobacter solisilvae]QSX79590.1 lamin tail domain-containing protein [Lysobacter solisilvae]
MNKYVGRLVWAAVAGIAPITGAHAQVVVSQVYGGGGNSGATLKSDFIELRNNGATAVNLAGWSVQYASAAGTSWTRTNLAGTIAAGGYYLIKQADGTGGTVTLPTPDATGTIAMSGTAGKIALVSNATTLSGACPLGGAVVDFVGFGTAATCAETAPTATLSNTTAAVRNGNGAVDTQNNQADFAVLAPNPRNSGTVVEPPVQALALTIAQIQGDGLRSAHVDKLVVTEGIVTARKFNNGFFLQSVTGDGNAATSEAVFVFTGSAPPATAAVGNRVRVTAKVEEFIPATGPHQLTITELSAPTIEVLATGETLPAPVELTAGDLGPGAQPATLERFEAMRVSVASAVVVGASEGRIDEDDATASSDGVFYVTLPDVATPFREPGIPALDVTPIPAGKNPPRFDTNPERLMVRSRGQIDALPLSVDNRAQVSGLLGVLDYFSGTWAMLPDTATPPQVSGGMAPTAVADAPYEAVTVGGFNLLRFFDEVADGNGAPTLKPEALDKRLTKTSAAICDYLKAPDILGVVEVENARVLQMLSDRLQATCTRAPAYVPYLVPGNDVGGINVGFLVASRDNGAGVARVEVLGVTQFGKDATLLNPNGSTDLLNDRPPLLLRARVHQDNGASYPITVVINHLRSLNGVDGLGAGSGGWASEGARVRAKRGAQAAYLAGLVEQLQQANPAEKIVLLGDFNTFEFNDGYVDVLGIVRGEEAAADQVLDYVDSPLTTPLVDGSQLIADPAQRYSYVFEGNAQTLDHALVNQSLLADALAVDVDHARINADFGVDNYADMSVPVRVSDHDPVRVAIAVPAFRSADLSVALATSTPAVHVGQTARYTLDVANAGPSAAASTAVALVFDARVAPAVTAPAGWTCAAPVQDPATTTVTCTIATLATGAGARLDVAVLVPDAIGGGALRLGVAVNSVLTDRHNGDNQAAVSVAVDAQANLWLSLSGPAKKLHYGRLEPFVVLLGNRGPDAAWQPVVTLRGDAPAANVAFVAPPGWTCGVDGDDHDFALTCRASGVVAAGSLRGLGVALRIPARSDSTQFLTLDASVASTTPDADTADNQAQYRNRIVGVP